MGNVLSMEVCGPELREQFETAIGENFSVRSLIKNVKERSLFPEARGVINSFVPDAYVRSAIAETHTEAHFTPRCEPNIDDATESADYVVINQPHLGYNTRVDVVVSPSALGVLYVPIAGIADTLSDPDKVPSRDTLANIAYRSIYAKTIAQYTVMQHMLPAIEDPTAMYKFQQITDDMYPRQFGQDGVQEFAARVDRIAMAFGGAVMHRLTATNLKNALGKDADAETPHIGQLLKLYAVGLSHIKPRDQQGVTFPLVHALRPRDAARFLKTWFS